MCQVLKVSRSGYYDWLKYPLSKRRIEDMKLKRKITEVYTNSRKTYGSPRIYQKLLREGYAIGKKRVERLMQELGIQAVAKRKYKATTDSGHSRSILGCRYHLHLHQRRLAIPGYHHGSLFPQDYRLVIKRKVNQRISYCRTSYGSKTEKTFC